MTQIWGDAIQGSSSGDGALPYTQTWDTGKESSSGVLPPPLVLGVPCRAPLLCTNPGGKGASGPIQSPLQFFLAASCLHSCCFFHAFSGHIVRGTDKWRAGRGFAWASCPQQLWPPRLRLRTLRGGACLCLGEGMQRRQSRGTLGPLGLGGSGAEHPEGRQRCGFLSLNVG